MTQPWEDDITDLTKELGTYNVFRITGTNTIASIKSYLSAFWDQNDGGPLDAALSDDYVNNGITGLIVDGFVTVDGSNIIHATSLTDGNPTPLKRVVGDDEEETLEYDV